MATVHTISPAPIDAPRYRLRLMGAFRLTAPDGRDVTPRSRKARALLAYLLLAGAPATRERLATLLWGDRAEEQARASLRQTLYEIKAVAEDSVALLNIGRENVSPNTGALSADLFELERDASRGSLAALTRALEQADTELLSDLTSISPDFDEWLAAERGRRRDQLIGTVVAAGERDLDQRTAGAIRRLADALERIDPLSEPVARLGMRADHLDADNAAMHRRYRRFVERLAADLDACPAQETEQLREALAHTAPDSAPATLPEHSQPPELLSPPQPGPARRWLRMVAAAAAALLLLIGVMTMRPPEGVPEPFVAVLPFAEIVPGSSHLATGLSEEILDFLGRDPAFRVIGSTSARMFTTGGDPLDVARRLGVTHLVEGSIRSDSDRVVVIARLVRSADGLHLWSERYDRPIKDIYAVQAEIGAAVARRLAGVSVTRAAAGPPAPPEVYERYLAARGLARERRLPALTEAHRLLEEAVRLDANFAAGYAGLAQLTMLLADHPTLYGSTPLPEAQRKARTYADRAIALDPNLAEAHAAYGLIVLNEADALRHYERAAALDPQRSDFHRWLGQSYAAVGRDEDALAAYRRAAALEPLWWMSMDHLVQQLVRMDQNEEAATVADNFDRIATDPYSRVRVRRTLALAEGRLADNLTLAAEAARLAPDERRSGADLAAAWAFLGENDRAIEALPASDNLARAALAGDLDALVTEAKRAGRDYWTQVSGRWGIDEMLVAGGRADVLVELYDARYAGAADFLAEQAGQGHAPAAPLAAALRAAGRERDAAIIIDHYLSRAAKDPGRAILRKDDPVPGAMLALGGRADAAMTDLAAAARSNWSSLLGLPNRPLSGLSAFRPLAGDARLAAIEGELRSRLDAERRLAGLPTPGGRGN